MIKGSNSEKLIPDAVQYPLLSVLLLKEMQQQKKEMEEQKRIIEQLQETIKKLEKKIDSKQP